MFKADNNLVKTIPPLAGPILQANDYIHPVFKASYNAYMRQRMGLEKDLGLRQAKDCVMTYEGSGLRKGLSLSLVTECAMHAWEKLPQSVIAASYVTTGWVTLEQVLQGAQKLVGEEKFSSHSSFNSV